MARICILSDPAPSHRMNSVRIAEELRQRGHELTHFRYQEIGFSADSGAAGATMLRSEALSSSGPV